MRFNIKNCCLLLLQSGGRFYLSEFLAIWDLSGNTTVQFCPIWIENNESTDLRRTVAYLANTVIHTTLQLLNSKRNRETDKAMAFGGTRRVRHLSSQPVGEGP